MNSDNKFTLDTLMQEVGCTKYPERWQEIFEDAMKRYDREGCLLGQASFYDRLQEKYGCFSDFGDIYKYAASKISEDEALGRFLVLMSMALNDKEHKAEDLKQFRRPITPEGKERAVYEMATGLALCSQLEGAAEALKAREIPQNYINVALRFAVNGARNYILSHNGEPGFDLLNWAQKYIEGKLFPIHRLEMEFFAKFDAKAKVFQNKQGEIISLAHDLALHRSGYALGSLHFEDEDGAWTAIVQEDDTAWTGYPFQDNAYVAHEKITLLKSEWTLVLEQGDAVVHVHIPPTGKLLPELIDETLDETKAFLKKYYPEFKYKAFACESWLMDPQLDDMLGKNTNIVKFSKRFHRLGRKSGGRGVFDFVFRIADEEIDIQNLPENTTLERKLKQHYLEGKAIYGCDGFFF